MSQFTPYGYDKIRTYFKDTFTFVGVGEGNTEHKRYSAVPSSISGNIISYTLTIDNVDGSFTGKTLNIAKVYDIGSGGTSGADATFTNFTFQSVDDVLTLTIKIEIPTV